MNSIEVGNELIHPQAFSYLFRVLSVIELSDGTKEVEAYHFPFNIQDSEVCEHFSGIRASNFMQQVQFVQTQKIPLPDAWYKINYIVSLGFPQQLDLSGATWLPPYAQDACEPFIVKRLN